MSASFYDLMKYAKLGIASPEMTYYDRLKASALFGGTAPDKTITGIPPLTLTAKKSGAATSYQLTGKIVQNGTPTSDAPIEIKGVGDRTENLTPFPYTSSGVGTTELAGITWTVSPNGSLKGTGVTTEGTNFYFQNRSFKLKAGTYTISIHGVHEGMNLLFRDNSAGITIATISSSMNVFTFTLDSDAEICSLYFNVSRPDISVNIDCTVMLNSGSTALPYEPYGYKILITSNGATAATIYLGQTQTVRRVKKLVLDGTENWQTLWGVLSLLNQISAITTPRIQTLICDRYVSKNNLMIAQGYPDSYGNNSITFRDYASTILIRDDTFGTDTESFKSYLAAQYAAGTPVTVWYVLATPETAIVNEPLMKIGDYADELRSSEQTAPLMLAKGVNVIDVDTEVKPSSMSITGQIK